MFDVMTCADAMQCVDVMRCVDVSLMYDVMRYLDVFVMYDVMRYLDLMRSVDISLMLSAFTNSENIKQHWLLVAPPKPVFQGKDFASVSTNGLLNP